MNQQNFSFIAGLVFLLVAIAHLWRIVEGWDVMVYGNLVPMWASWVSMFVAAILAFYGFRYGLYHPHPHRSHHHA